MSHGCSYCGQSGHNVTTCPERQRDHFGTPGDPSAAMDDQTRTDGGTDPTESEAFEVVISPEDGLGEDHARLMRKRLIQDGFHGEAVEVREVQPKDGDVRTDGGGLADYSERSDSPNTYEHRATLAFATEYVGAVRAREKTVTLRRPGAYDVEVRHAAERDTEIVLVDADGEPFARAEIRAVWKVDAETVAEARLAGYPDVACADDVVRILERHYELAIEGDAAHTRVHAIHFDVTELLRPAVLEGGGA